MFCKFIKNETPVQVFFCEFCDVFRNTFFPEDPCPLKATGSRRTRLKKFRLSITLKIFLHRVGSLFSFFFSRSSLFLCYGVMVILNKSQIQLLQSLAVKQKGRKAGDESIRNLIKVVSDVIGNKN